MNTIREETWLLIDDFFKDMPEGISKVKSLQENLMDKWHEGRNEGDQQRQLMIASNMLGKLSDQEIMEFTELSLNELQSLKQN